MKETETNKQLKYKREIKLKMKRRKDLYKYKGNNEEK